jgi:hypothetical protein
MHTKRASFPSASALAFVLVLTLRADVSPASDAPRTYPPAELAPKPIGSAGPRAGSVAPDFSLTTLDGKPVTASKLWAEKPTVIMTGSHTCPVFRRTATPFEELAREFGERVNFLIIYTLEAHPSGEHSIYFGRENVTPANKRDGILWRDPRTAGERLGRAKECVAALGLKTTVVLDTMDNANWKAYGSAPNCAYLVGRDGKVVEAQPWFDARPMREAIVRLLAKE